MIPLTCHNSSVIRQKGESQNWCFKKTKGVKFSENEHFLPVKNVQFSENLARFVFLKHQFWDSPFCLITPEVTAVQHISILKLSKKSENMCVNNLKFQMVKKSNHRGYFWVSTVVLRNHQWQIILTHFADFPTLKD